MTRIGRDCDVEDAFDWDYSVANYNTSNELVDTTYYNEDGTPFV